MIPLSKLDCEVLLAKGEPRPLFVVIRPKVPITPHMAEDIRDAWKQFVDANPTENIPPCIVVSKDIDIEAVYDPESVADD